MIIRTSEMLKSHGQFLSNILYAESKLGIRIWHLFLVDLTSEQSQQAVTRLDLNERFVKCAMIFLILSLLSLLLLFSPGSNAGWSYWSIYKGKQSPPLYYMYFIFEVLGLYALICLFLSAS